MTVNGFSYISAGCRLLREVVINDMPTLSDRCVLVSLHNSELCPKAMLGCVYLTHSVLAGSDWWVSLSDFHLSAGRPSSF